MASSSEADLSKYLPLYRAALRGDWETAKTFFQDDADKAKAIITTFSETPLHVAVTTGKANDFVKKLVDILPADALIIKDKYGQTALHRAAGVGNTEAVVILVTKNPDLLYILNGANRLPVEIAAVYCHKETLKYLISVSKPKVDMNAPFDGELGVNLLITTISSEFFDIALDLVSKYPHLACLQSNKYSMSPLQNLAVMSLAFPSAQRFSWWQNLIYRCIPIKESKWKGVLTADIENVNSDTPQYSTSFRIISAGKYLDLLHSLIYIDGSFNFKIFEIDKFWLLFAWGTAAQKLKFMVWKVILHLVPQVKGMRDKKVKHQQSLQLVKCLSLQIVSLPEAVASQMFWNIIFKAATYGIKEIVEVVIDMYPISVYARDDSTGMRIFHVAASYRFEKVFNLFYSLSSRKYEFFHEMDNQDNNLMHMCGKLAPPNRLNLVRGAALQMQRELQWFKEMEKVIHPSRGTWMNKQKQTPQMLFTMEHQQLKIDGERWMKDTANACTIATALIATVVFASAFTVPGGVVSESGIPLFLNEFPFVVFAISDAVSLFTSITSLLMFLSILTSRYAEQDFLYVLPKRLSIGLLTLFVSIIFMVVAFSATLYLVVQSRLKWFLIPVVMLACLPVTSFVLLQFPLLVDVVYSTYGPGIFGKKSDHLLY